MKTLYLNPSAGIAGDMTVGALLALGADTELFWSTLRSLPLAADEWKVRSEATLKNGIGATQFHVVVLEPQDEPGRRPGQTQAAAGEASAPVATAGGLQTPTLSGVFEPVTKRPHAHVSTPGHTHDHAHDHTHPHDHAQGQAHSHGAGGVHSHRHAHHHRHLPQILEIIAESGMSATAKARATRVFHALAAAEARVHAVPPEKVHFHEVGAVDAIADICGTCIALDVLGVERIVCGPVALGGGTVRCDHGIMPVPAPATAYLLEGFETRLGPAQGELTTPTGAAILRALVDAHEPQVRGRIRAVGYGAGTKDFDTHANVLQALLLDETPTATPAAGAAPEATADATPTQIVLLACTLDDMPGEQVGHLIPTLMAAGALDVAVTPCLMKKGRQGMNVQVMASADRRADLADLLLRHTSTFGVRWHAAERLVLRRRMVNVDTPLGQVDVKLGYHPATGELLRIAPEYESCARVAAATQRPLAEVYERALAAATAAYRD